MTSYSRAVLTDAGIMIKDQQSFSGSGNTGQQIANPFEDDEEERELRKSFDTSSLISCVTCLSESDPSGQDRGNGPLPANTLIPYTKILNASEVCAVSTELTPYRDEIGERQPKRTGDAVVSTLVEVTYAKPRRHDLVPKKQLLCVAAIPSGDVVEEILKRSYAGTKRSKSILIIMNPHGGKGHAKKLALSLQGKAHFDREPQLCGSY